LSALRSPDALSAAISMKHKSVSTRSARSAVSQIFPMRFAADTEGCDRYVHLKHVRAVLYM
jgi:hypothetical protein